MTWVKDLLVWCWRMMIDRCPHCGGRLNQVWGFGPEFARRASGIYVWCPACYSKAHEGDEDRKS